MVVIDVPCFGVEALAPWRRDLAPGRAAVVRERVSRATVPVLLFPVQGEPEMPV